MSGATLSMCDMYDSYVIYMHSFYYTSMIKMELEGELIIITLLIILL